jgi:alkaline phosphatase
MLLSVEKRLLGVVLLFAILSLPLRLHAQENPKNVILIIGDGMDDQQITIARNYLRGAGGRLAIDRLPIRSAVQVLTVDESNPEKPVYVADSANSATAMATGVVTSRGRIATAAQSNLALKSITEIAIENGVRTGAVTTASVTDATPASFLAHSVNRGCQGAINMRKEKCTVDRLERGGKGSIAHQISTSSIDILLGGGRQHFDASILKSQGFHLVESKEALEHLPYNGKVLGLFSEGDLPVQLRGENNHKAEFLDFDGQSIVAPPAFSCIPNPLARNVPSLKTMTEKAIAHLDRNNERGFFLMVESASIDKQAHRRQPCGSIGELEQLDEALGVALEFAAGDTNTLVLVTADHGQAAQLVPYPSMLPKNENAFSIGRLAVIKTPEGGLMGVSYATNNAAYEEHTGTQVPLMMNFMPPERAQPVFDQPQLFSLMRSFLRM